MSIKPTKPIICYYTTDKLQPTHFIKPPTQFDNGRSTSARIKTSNFEINFIDFPENVNGIGPKAALQYAAQIWSNLISSPVTIKIDATWADLPPGVLAETDWSSAYSNFQNAPNLNTFYPVALAEKIAGKNLNKEVDSDIKITLSKKPNWYYKIDGNTPNTAMDFVTVSLHEIAHGLGITDTYNVVNEQGFIGTDRINHMVYDININNAKNENLFLDVASPSTSMKTNLTSGKLFYNSLTASSTLNGKKPKLFAPGIFSLSSSISHLDDGTFPPGDINSLMTSVINVGESIHNPGPVTLGILADLGWFVVTIEHTKLKDTEQLDMIPYAVKATITSENGSNDNKFISEAKLNYTTDGLTFSTVPFASTNNLNEFIALLPGTDTTTIFEYYISVVDSLGRTFCNPGKRQERQTQPVQRFFKFKAGIDNEAPRIIHRPVNYVYDSAISMDVLATVNDNLGVNDVILEYYINDDSVIISTSMSPLANNQYMAIINLPDTLEIGDRIKYRIVAEDLSATKNKTISPALNYYETYVAGFLPVSKFYLNNFDEKSFDFIGAGFGIKTFSGFLNPAIHTDHPYVIGSGLDNNIYTYQLMVPIKLNAENPTIKFDEVALVEPGRTGYGFGEKYFYDYVVVEGSNDRGGNWTPFVDGYDARYQPEWLNQWNLSEGHSTPFLGNSTLYRKRIINMLSSNTFKEGDEIIIRFRMFSDDGIPGWGWAIDNLEIQSRVFDETISIYPNPVIDKMVLEVNTDGPYPLQIQIIDLQGRALSTNNFETVELSFRNEFDLSDFRSGLYILKVAVDGKVYSRKFKKD